MSYITTEDRAIAQNPLHTFPRNFRVANLSRTCYGETGVMDLGLYVQGRIKAQAN